MYAIIVTGGKQYKVAEGDTIYPPNLLLMFNVIMP